MRQTDIPRVALKEALRIPEAIAESYGKAPTRPLDVAAALNLSPTSSGFRHLCGAAIGYGLTDGGPNAPLIALRELGRRIVAPLRDGDDLAAKREAALQPSIMRSFLEKYDGSPLPGARIAMNVLETLGVPEDATERVFRIIVENATDVQFLKPIKDKTYVDIAAVTRVADEAAPGVDPDEGDDSGSRGGESPSTGRLPIDPASGWTASPSTRPNRRVFISHGKNRRIVDQLKELLAFGDFEPIVSVEKETASKPVPEKVLDDMRACSSGIIHVSPEEKLMDQAGAERLVLNSNVLIEIGAALALYKDRFILLVENGTTLPSNLQGLYEVRYDGTELGYEATMKVLKALNSFKAGGGNEQSWSGPAS